MFFLGKPRLAVVVVGAIAWGATVRHAAAEAAGQAQAPGPANLPEYDAKFVRMDQLPKKLLTGQVFRAAITMKNTGTQSWGPEIKKHSVLRSEDPADNTTWGTHFFIQGQGTTCKPGNEFTYVSWLKAPSTPGEYVFQWRVARMDRGSYHGPSPPFPPPQDRSEKRVLSVDDFQYAGSFRIPDRSGQDLPFSHSGLALRNMTDGTKRLLFNYTLPGMVLVEVEIPALVKLDKNRNYGALKTAQVKQEWGSPAVKTPKIAGHDLEKIYPNGGFWWDDDKNILYWTWWHPYWCGEAPPVLAASKLAEDGTVTSYGPWFVRDHFKSYLSYITGSCFDEQEKLLYVYGVLSRGCIHVYRVKDADGVKQEGGNAT